MFRFKFYHCIRKIFFFWLSHFIIFPTIVHKIASRILVSCYKERYDKIDAHKGLVALHFNGHNGVKNLSEITLQLYVSVISKNKLTGWIHKNLIWAFKKLFFSVLDCPSKKNQSKFQNLFFDCFRNEIDLFREGSKTEGISLTQ